MSKLYDEDKSSWITGSCKNSLNIMSIKFDASVYLCYCSDWIPKSLCNILEIDNRQQFWDLFENNPVRDSIVDQSHRYCLGSICSILQNLYYKKTDDHFVHPSKLPTNNIIKQLRLILDESCNLMCPSCRSNLIVRRDPTHLQNIKNILSKIDEFFFNPLQVKSIWLDGAGEFSSNPIILDWMVKKIETSDVKFELITNGTLLYKNKEAISKILSRTTEVEISIDASNADVYSKTRINGNWENLLKGLELLRDMRKKYGFTIRSNYVVSSNNYDDINDFITFSKNQKFSRINFTRIRRRSNMSNKEWQELDIFDTNHPSYPKFIESLKNLNCKIPNNFNDVLQKIVYK